MDENEGRFFAGVDWATEKHDVWVSDDRGEMLGKKTFVHSGTGLVEMQDYILSVTKSTPDNVFVAIEVPYGPVVESLVVVDAIVVWPTASGSPVAALASSCEVSRPASRPAAAAPASPKKRRREPRSPPGSAFWS